VIITSAINAKPMNEDDFKRLATRPGNVTPHPTLHPTPRTSHPTPCILHPTPFKRLHTRSGNVSARVK